MREQRAAAPRAECGGQPNGTACCRGAEGVSVLPHAETPSSQLGQGHGLSTFTCSRHQGLPLKDTSSL